MEEIIKFLIQPWVSIPPLTLITKILDIAIVAYIIYRILITLKGTRTIAIAIGFLGVYLLYIFSGKLGLETLSSLFDAFFSKLSIFVIFALIIFQEDIRRALTRMGTFKSRAPFIQTKAIEEVVQAAGALANKRIGALIVFEGKADLDLFITEGIELDSSLTRETLFSIFIPSFENPLHDGAVLIRNFRIYKAAAIIKHLTVRTDLPKEMGTRHRAAIGITEETDSVAIVVSEERGSISVCFHGNIVESVSMGDLRNLLEARFRSLELRTKRDSLLKKLRGKKAGEKNEKQKDEKVTSQDTIKIKKDIIPVKTNNLAGETELKTSDDSKEKHPSQATKDSTSEDQEALVELLTSK